MRRSRKQYSTPRKPWESRRLTSERRLLNEYGLKNKKEIWRMEEVIRNFRRQARDIIADQNQERGELLIRKLRRLGFLSNEATLDNVLSLTVTDIMRRRLQTAVFQKGLANTVKQARQIIVHGHILINGKRMTVPSYIIMPEEEQALESTFTLSDTEEVVPQKKPEVKEEDVKSDEASQKDNSEEGSNE